MGMLFGSQVTDALKRAIAGGAPIMTDPRLSESRRAVNYYESVRHQAEDLRTQMRSQHYDKSTWDALPKRCYNLTRAVTDTHATLYSDPVTYSWDDTDPLQRRAAELWDIYGVAPIHKSAMKDTDRLTYLAGLTVVRPIVQVRNGKRILKFAIYIQDQVEYTQDPEDPTEAQEVIFSSQTGQGEASQTVRHVWREDSFIRQVDDVVVDHEWGQDNPFLIMPFTIFRNDEARYEFYAEPASDLVAANLTLNDLCTAFDDMVIVQGSGQLLSFNGPKNPMLGRRAVVEFQVPPGATADMRYLTSGVDITGWIATININLELFFASRRIPKAAIMAQQAGDSGIAIVAQASSLVDYRLDRIATFQPMEEDLIRRTLRVLEFHETGRLVDFPAPSIRYTEPQKPMSSDRQAQIVWEIQSGAASVVDYVREKRPDLSHEDAEEMVRENLRLKREFEMGEVAARMAGKSTMPPPEVGDDTEDEPDTEDETEDDTE